MAATERAEPIPGRATNPDDESDVPGEVLQFLTALDYAVHHGDVQTANSLYEIRFPQLTAHFFSNRMRNYGAPQPFRPWPSLKFVKKKFSSPAMELLYEGMYFRHMYMDRIVPAYSRGKSWENYKGVFDLLMNTPISMDLSNGWLWDILDEYLYQLHIHHTKRLKYDSALPAHAWSISEAAMTLDRLVDDTKILPLLKRVMSGEVSVKSLLCPGPNHIQQALGLFAVICRMRIRVMLGDYRGALHAAEPLGLHSFGKNIVAAVAPAHAALYYNLGFAYLLLRRYTDATTMLKQALHVKAVNRQYVDSLQAQVVSLIMISAALGSLPMHDFSSYLSDRAQHIQEDDMQTLLQGDIERFREVFTKSCPKFLSLVDPLASTTYTQYTGQEGKELQTRVFMRDVQQQVDVLRLRGYLRVYHTTDVNKIATLLGSAKEDAHAPLICAKLQSREVTHDGVSDDLLAGTLKSGCTMDFSVEGNSVFVKRRDETIPTLARFLQRLESLKEQRVPQRER